MEEDVLKYILTYEGNKDDFMKEYNPIFERYNCNIDSYILDEQAVIFFIDYKGDKPGELESKLAELNKGNLYVERDSKKRWISECNEGLFGSK
ncbi:MAG: hypothetical protein ACQESF_05105 [Nanobdellota archaeon]